MVIDPSIDLSNTTPTSSSITQELYLSLGLIDDDDDDNWRIRFNIDLCATLPLMVDVE